MASSLRGVNPAHRTKETPIPQFDALVRTRRWIVDEERHEAERRRSIEARPPVPDWLIEQSIGHHAPPVYVHVGGCHLAGRRSKGGAREQAVRALTEGVDACPHCRPDTDLGYIDG